MTRKLSEKFPWHRCMPGESFFVPTLHPSAVIEAGLLVGLQYCQLRQPPRAKFCIYDGILGVMFTMPGRARVSKPP